MHTVQCNSSSCRVNSIPRTISIGTQYFESYTYNIYLDFGFYCVIAPSRRTNNVSEQLFVVTILLLNTL